MPHNPLLPSLLALGALSLVACSSAPAPPAKTGAAASKTNACEAELAWLTSSTLPTEVASSHTACDFEKFMWQSMLALVQPTRDPSIVNFENGDSGESTRKAAKNWASPGLFRKKRMWLAESVSRDSHTMPENRATCIWAYWAASATPSS